MSRIAHYCPLCATALEHHQHSGRVRPVCPACGHVVYFDPKVAVVVWIERGDEVLFIQRAGDPGKGKWALPAGFVEYDEPPETAAVREVLEETGLQVHIEQLMDVFPKRDTGMADIVIAYAASIIGGNLGAADDAMAVGWFTRATVPELVFYPSIMLVERWRGNTLK